MRAIRLTDVGEALEAQDVDLAARGPHDVHLRVGAAGICHSDAHYRSGTSPAGPLPLTLGHEVAGTVEAVGTAVREFKTGDRVCVHYMVTCGECDFCRRGAEQFCVQGQMIGKDRDGGYAEVVVVPERSLVSLPDVVSFEEGAVMMCSASTSLHALRRARLCEGDTVAVFGVGGLGIAAVQLAQVLGASRVYAVDIKPAKLALAESYGAVPIDASALDPVASIKNATKRGVDVALEVIGLPETIQQSLRVLAVGGRAVIAGITDESVAVAPYAELICREGELMGASDHTKSELVELVEMVEQGRLNLRKGISRTVGLDADEINAALDELETFGDSVRMVIVP